jgi:flap endonuclease-1
MGIKFLNRYLKENCPQSIKRIKMTEISYKKIVVDISIYLYKYEIENALLENMFVMLSVFRYYNIIPIFIFDGKPPPEKKALLQKRKNDKEMAQKEYNELNELLTSPKDEDKDLNESEKQEIMDTMNKLKKRFVQISKDKNEKVKSLIRAYGATYYDAPGEADELCALLVIKKKVWACLSEDMDLFVYGCTRVLRYLSLFSHTVVIYYVKGIYNELKMTDKEFKEICILSGTDYNFNTDNNNQKINLKLTLKHFNKFKESNESNNINFYDWLLFNTDYISDIDLLNKINNMFNLDCDHEKLDIFNNIKIVNGQIRQDEIKNIMKDEDFIFL